MFSLGEWIVKWGQPTIQEDSDEECGIKMINTYNTADKLKNMSQE
jgi:hypothetical protein